MKKFFLLVLVITLAGCAARSNRQMTQEMNSRVGQNIAQVIDAWGPPSTVYDEDQSKVYVWSSQNSFTTPGRSRTVTYGPGTTRERNYPGVTITRNDYKMLWVDAGGTVTKWRIGSN